MDVTLQWGANTITLPSVFQLLPVELVYPTVINAL